jgi:hypothetical protein
MENNFGKILDLFHQLFDFFIGILHFPLVEYCLFEALVLDARACLFVYFCYPIATLIIKLQLELQANIRL